jgi:hypothetical protein
MYSPIAGIRPSTNHKGSEGNLHDAEPHQTTDKGQDFATKEISLGVLSEMAHRLSSRKAADKSEIRKSARQCQELD